MERYRNSLVIILVSLIILSSVGIVLLLQQRIMGETALSSGQPTLLPTVVPPTTNSTPIDVLQEATQPSLPTPTLAAATAIPTATPVLVATAVFSTTTPAPAETTPIASDPSPTPDLFDVEIEAMLATLTLEQKIAQMLMVGVPGMAVNDTSYHRIVNQGIGGVIFLPGNITSAEQVAAFTTSLQQAALNEGLGIPLFIGWNHEGGRIVRRNAGLTRFPSNMALGAADQPDMVQAVGEAVGQEMASLGVNMNFAPVLDVNTEPANPIIGLRAYDDTPYVVASLGHAYITGQQTAGVIAVAKHFPGHGGVDVDSHLALPQFDQTLEGLWQTELPPFQEAATADVGAMMIAHLKMPNLDPSGLPSSLSPMLVNDLLRTQMGYDGVVMTDDMGMRAIVDNYSLARATVLAVQAGNDVLLAVEPYSFPDVMIEALLTAVSTGQISEERINESVRRILRLKYRFALDQLSDAPLLADQATHQALAGQVGGQAVHVVRDDVNWLPLSLPNNQLLLISPNRINGGSIIGDGYSSLAEALQAKGVVVTERFYDERVLGDVAATSQTAVSLMSSVDAAVVVLWDANLRYAQWADTAQEQMVQALLATGKPVVVVFGQLPYDAARVPSAPAQIAAYGDTVGQLWGVASLLVR
ncbi:MAG: glycoside hydrolase family 3 N-terminal domain-containing protein [Chloroflexota bacterium]